LPFKRDACLISSSISNRFYRNDFALPLRPRPLSLSSPSHPRGVWCGVGEKQLRLRRTRASQPFQIVYFSRCTFSRPIDFIFAAPPLFCFALGGRTSHTRSDVRRSIPFKYWKAVRVQSCPSPAIRAKRGALFRPRLGPLGSSSALTAPLRAEESATLPNPARVLMHSMFFLARLKESSRIHFASICASTCPFRTHKSLSFRTPIVFRNGNSSNSFSPLRCCPSSFFFETRFETRFLYPHVDPRLHLRFEDPRETYPGGSLSHLWRISIYRGHRLQPVLSRASEGS